MSEPVQLAFKFNDFTKRYGWVAATTFMFGLLVYKIKKEDQKSQKYHDPNTDDEDEEYDIENGENNNNKAKNNGNQSNTNQSTEDVAQFSNNNLQNQKNQKKINSTQNLGGANQNQKKYQLSTQGGDISSQNLSEDDYESKIMSLKKPINKIDVLKHSRSQMQYNFLKKSRVQHFDEEEQGGNIYSDIDNRQTHYLKNKFQGDIHQRVRQFASDQDEETLNQYQKNQLKRIIKDQEDQQDQLFFKIYGEFIIDEKNEEESDY